MAPTKHEIAEGMTIAQLRAVAEQEDVDLSGLTSKQDIAEAVAASVSREKLQSAASEGQEQPQGGAFAEQRPATADVTNPSASDVPSDRPTYQDGVDEQAGEQPFDVGNQGRGSTDWSPPPPTSSTNRESIEAEDIPLADAELPPLGPPNPEPRTPDAQAPRNERGQTTNDPEALQKAGQSPADLEVPGLGQSGRAQIVKQNPEVPSVHQIAGALSAVPGQPETRVTVHDGNGDEMQHALGTDDLALIGSRAAATLTSHPAHSQPGHWSNPNLRDMTDEERKADAAAYEERFG